ncbi:MAG: abortive phage infection protein [Kribbellaceae bacterium]|nr:abortive phage infection protein [Kribbellaceae bacterium]
MTINRAQFLALGAASAAAGITAQASVAAADAQATAAVGGAQAAATPSRLTLRGVAYDTGGGSDDSRARWRHSIMRGEIHAIRHRLHANWVSIYGSDVRRLIDTATVALEAGLTVSIQPRSFDEPPAVELEKLRQVAVEAERLRKCYDREVILVVGCEFMLFTPGIVPGTDFFERVEYLTKGGFDMAVLQRRFRAFTARMVKVARSHFHGRITYGAASDLEQVDWSIFDLVGLDYYSYHARAVDHAKELAPFRRWQKPILILEFGCCTFTGAAKLGGMGWDIVDYSGDVPVIPPQYVRDEQEQADHLAHMLRIFADQGFLGASPYTFISPDAPHRPHDRPHDEDMAAFSLCKVLRYDDTDPASAYRWLPKKSFRAVSRMYLSFKD